MCEIDAQTTLTDIAAGTVPNVVLILIPLMQGGDNAAIIQQWLSLAAAEANDYRKSLLGSLALIFAGATTGIDLWRQALKGWNMIQSPIVQEWQAEARMKGKPKVARRHFCGCCNYVMEPSRLIWPRRSTP